MPFSAGIRLADRFGRIVRAAPLQEGFLMYAKPHIPKRLRCLAWVLVLAMLCNTGVLADTVTSSVTVTYDDGYRTTYALTTSATFRSTYAGLQLAIEAQLEASPDTQAEVKACDIIFVLDQSKFVNGSQGTERAAIINAISEIADNLATPTTGGEHRIAIAGYGRVNVGSNIDSYNATDYPGLQQTGTAISLNTGQRSLFK
jgi:hypothetical protein